MDVPPRPAPTLLLLLATAVALPGRLVVGDGDGITNIRRQLDVQPGERQKPYSPADGQRVAVTPPPFIWIPVKGSVRYALQVSRSERFTGAETRGYEKIATSVFVPPDVLPPGQWYWRYGVHAGETVVWGRARPFEVPAGTIEFPFPDMAAAIDRVPRGRPRLLFTAESLARLRRAARGELASEIEGLVARCRRALGGEIVPEPPRPETGPEKVRVMRTTRPPMDEMERCALAYLITGDEELGKEAHRRLLHFFSWDPKGSTGLWSYDEPAMWVMMRGVRAYDWTYSLFSAQERSRIEPVMRERARQFYVHLRERRRFETDPYESHAGRMPGFLGEAALCFAHEWPEAREWLEYATLLYATSYPAWGGDDGGWQEGPGYWSAYMGFALHYVVALRMATGIDLMRKPFFRNTPYYALYTATPYHEHRPFGDGATSSPRGLGRVMYAFASLLEDPCLKWYHRESGQSVGDSLLTLSTYAPELEARVPLDLPHARTFPSVGLAALHTALGDRERDVTFLLRSSPYGSVSHGHADQNAFVIEAYGRGLALATGYYPWYGSPHHQRWTRSTRSVNSILVDGQGQKVRSWQASGRLIRFESHDGYDYIEAEAGTAYVGRLERFRRHVVHVRPATFVIFDDLAATEPSTFQWLLHAHDRFDVEGHVLVVRREPAAMRVHILLPGPVEISQDDRYVPEPEEETLGRDRWETTWHLQAATAERSRATRFLTVFQVHRTDDETPLARVALIEGDGAVGVALESTDGVRDVVAFRTRSDGGPVTCGGLTSLGRVFARKLNRAGEVRGSMDTGD